MECVLLFSAVHEGGHDRRKPLRSFAASVSVLRSLHSISPHPGRGGSGDEEDDDDGDGGDEVLAFRFSVQIPPGQQSDPRLFSPTARCSFTTRVEYPAIPPTHHNGPNTRKPDCSVSENVYSDDMFPVQADCLSHAAMIYTEQSNKPPLLFSRQQAMMPPS